MIRHRNRTCGVGLALLVLMCAAAAPPEAAGARPRSRADREGALKLGQPAPDFDLAVLDPKTHEPLKVKDDDGAQKVQTFKLSSLQGKKPVVLVFGSYT